MRFLFARSARSWASTAWPAASRARSARVLFVLVLVASGCPGETVIPSRKDGGPGNDGPWADLFVPPKDGGPPPVDLLAADTFDPCAIFAQEGSNCSGGQSCPQGLQPTTDPQGGCRCRVSCNPTQSGPLCGGSCGRLCIQLYDSGGQPLPGIGACFADEGVTEGEGCAPASCKQGLVCVGDQDNRSFCRRTCQQDSDCAGFKMLCLPLTGTTSKVCIQGGSTTGPGEGGSCAGVDDYCKQGLLCDPAAKLCHPACNTDDVAAPNCGTGKSCVKLTDAAAGGVVVGYGCK